MTDSETLSCYCGKCTVTVTGEPAVQCNVPGPSTTSSTTSTTYNLLPPPPQVQLFCHCESCRKWGGACAQAAKLYPKDAVKVVGEMITKDKNGKVRSPSAVVDANHAP